MADNPVVIKPTCSAGETGKRTKLRIRAKRSAAHPKVTRIAKVAKREHALNDHTELETSRAATHTITVGFDDFPIGSLRNGQSKKHLNRNSTKSNVKLESSVSENLNKCQEIKQSQQLADTTVNGNPATARSDQYANVQVKQEPVSSPSYRGFAEEYNGAHCKGSVVSTSVFMLQEGQRDTFSSEHSRTKSPVSIASQPKGRKNNGKRSLEKVIASIKLKSGKEKEKFISVSPHNVVGAETERPLKTGRELNNSTSDSSAMVIQENSDDEAMHMPKIVCVQQLTGITSSRSSTPAEDNLTSTHNNFYSSSAAVPQNGYHTKAVSTGTDSHSAELCTQHIPANHTAKQSKKSQQNSGNSSGSRNLVKIAPKPNPSYLHKKPLPGPGLLSSVNQAANNNNRSCVGKFDAIQSVSTRNVINSTLEVAHSSSDSCKAVSDLNAVPHVFLTPQPGNANGKPGSVIVVSHPNPQNANSHEHIVLDSADVPQTLQTNTNRSFDKTVKSQASQNNNSTVNARLILSDASCGATFVKSSSFVTTSDHPNRDTDPKQSSNYQISGSSTINPQSITNRACNSEVINSQSQLGKGVCVTDVTKSCFLATDSRSQPSEKNAQRGEAKYQTRKKCQSNPAKLLPDNDLLSTNKKCSTDDRDFVLFSDLDVSEGQANTSEVVTSCNSTNSKDSIFDTVLDDCDSFLPASMNPDHRKARVRQLFKRLTDDELKEFALPRLGTDRATAILPVIYPRILPKPSRDQNLNGIKEPSLPLPFEIVSGKLMQTNIIKPKADISDEEFLDFVRNKPRRSVRLLNSAEDLSKRKFLPTHLFPEFFERHNKVLVEMAANMLLELNISQLKYNVFLRKEVGSKLQTVLGYNIFPPLGKVIPLSRKIQEDLRGVPSGRIIDKSSSKRKNAVRKSAKRQKVASYDPEEEETELAITTEEEQDKSINGKGVQEEKDSECFSCKLNSNDYHREVLQETPDENLAKEQSTKLCQSTRGTRLSSRLSTSNKNYSEDVVPDYPRRCMVRGSNNKNVPEFDERSTPARSSMFSSSVPDLSGQPLTKNQVISMLQTTPGPSLTVGEGTPLLQGRLEDSENSVKDFPRESVSTVARKKQMSTTEARNAFKPGMLSTCDNVYQSLELAHGGSLPVIGQVMDNTSESCGISSAMPTANGVHVTKNLVHASTQVVIDTLKSSVLKTRKKRLVQATQTENIIPSITAPKRRNYNTKARASVATQASSALSIPLTGIPRATQTDCNNGKVCASTRFMTTKSAKQGKNSKTQRSSATIKYTATNGAFGIAVQPSNIRQRRFEQKKYSHASVQVATGKREICRGIRKKTGISYKSSQHVTTADASTQAKITRVEVPFATHRSTTSRSVHIASKQRDTITSAALLEEQVTPTEGSEVGNEFHSRPVAKPVSAQVDVPQTPVKTSLYASLLRSTKASVIPFQGVQVQNSSQATMVLEDLPLRILTSSQQVESSQVRPVEKPTPELLQTSQATAAHASRVTGLPKTPEETGNDYTSSSFKSSAVTEHHAQIVQPQSHSILRETFSQETKIETLPKTTLVQTSLVQVSSPAVPVSSVQTGNICTPVQASQVIFVQTSSQNTLTTDSYNGSRLPQSELVTSFNDTPMEVSQAKVISHLHSSTMQTSYQMTPLQSFAKVKPLQTQCHAIYTKVPSHSQVPFSFTTVKEESDTTFCSQSQRKTSVKPLTVPTPSDNTRSPTSLIQTSSEGISQRTPSSILETKRFTIDRQSEKERVKTCFALGVYTTDNSTPICPVLSNADVNLNQDPNTTFAFSEHSFIGLSSTTKIDYLDRKKDFTEAPLGLSSTTKIDYLDRKKDFTEAPLGLSSTTKIDYLDRKKDFTEAPLGLQVEDVCTETSSGTSYSTNNSSTLIQVESTAEDTLGNRDRGNCNSEEKATETTNVTKTFSYNGPGISDLKRFLANKCSEGSFQQVDFPSCSSSPTEDKSPAKVQVIDSLKDFLNSKLLERKDERDPVTDNPSQNTGGCCPRAQALKVLRIFLTNGRDEKQTEDENNEGREKVETRSPVVEALKELLANRSNQEIKKVSDMQYNEQKCQDDIKEHVVCVLKEFLESRSSDKNGKQKEFGVDMPCDKVQVIQTLKEFLASKSNRGQATVEAFEDEQLIEENICTNANSPRFVVKQLRGSEELPVSIDFVETPARKKQGESAIGKGSEEEAIAPITRKMPVGTDKDVVRPTQRILGESLVNTDVQMEPAGQFINKLLISNESIVSAEHGIDEKSDNKGFPKIARAERECVKVPPRTVTGESPVCKDVETVPLEQFGGGLLVSIDSEIVDKNYLTGKSPVRTDDTKMTPAGHMIRDLPIITHNDGDSQRQCVIQDWNVVTDNKVVLEEFKIKELSDNGGVKAVSSDHMTGEAPISAHIEAAYLENIAGVLPVHAKDEALSSDDMTGEASISADIEAASLEDTAGILTVCAKGEVVSSDDMVGELPVCADGEEVASEAVPGELHNCPDSLVMPRDQTEVEKVETQETSDDRNEDASFPGKVIGPHEATLNEQESTFLLTPHDHRTKRLAEDNQLTSSETKERRTRTARTRSSGLISRPTRLSQRTTEISFVSDDVIPSVSVRQQTISLGKRSAYKP